MLNMTYFGSNPRDTHSGVAVDLGWSSTTITECRSVTPKLIQNNKENKILRSWPDSAPDTDKVTVTLPDAGKTQQVHFELWCTTLTKPDRFLCGKSPSFMLLPPLLGTSLTATATTPSATFETSTSSMSFTTDVPYTPDALPTPQISRKPSFPLGAIIGVAIVALITLAILCGCTMRRRRSTFQKISVIHPETVAPGNTNSVQCSEHDNDARRLVASTSMRIPQSTVKISYPIVMGIGDDGGEGPHRTLAPPPMRLIDVETQTPPLTPIPRARVAMLHHLPAPTPVAIPPSRSHSRRAPSARCYTCQCHLDYVGNERDPLVQQQQRCSRDTCGSEEQIPMTTGSDVEDLNRHVDGYLQELHHISLDSSTLGLSRGNMYQCHDKPRAFSRYPDMDTGSSAVSSWRSPPPPPLALYC